MTGLRDIPRRWRLAAPFLAVLILLQLAPQANAHHDVATVIAELTVRIEGGEHSANLYFRRATKYRILRQPDQAEADLRRALKIDSTFTPAHRELARLLAAEGRPDAAITAAERAIEEATTGTSRAAALIILARLRAQVGQAEDALLACEEAFRLRSVRNVDWYLLHAEILASLGRTNECPRVLLAGHAATHSIVLRDAWIDALLDAGQPTAARPVIDAELATSRLKSSWLLRRARARLLTGEQDAAEDDLEACLLELAPRIHPSRPDLTLIADRGLANALLGRSVAARADLARTRSAGVDPWVTAPLERALDPGGR